MSTLYLIRHGQASFGIQNYDKLSERGVLQSRVFAEHILKNNIQFSACYTGAMTRHKETLVPLINLYGGKGSASPPVGIIEEFNEYDWLHVITEIFPQLMKEDPSLNWDMKKILGDKKTFQRIFETAILRWVSGNYSSTSLSKWEDFLSRVHRGIERIMKKHGSGEHVAVFTSGGPISAVLQKVLNLSNEDTVRISWLVVNASVTRFKFTHDRITLFTFNEHSFLEEYAGDNLVTFR
jgi:broad specificity phosphatase PhoE